MKLTDNDIETLHQLAKKAALKAGEYIQQYDRTKLDVLQKKGGGSEASQVVTEVDFHCQGLILEELFTSIKTYDLGVLTEELEDDMSRFEKDYFWCIDPLDGTLPYIENRDGYSVSIALVSKTGESIIGVIYDPVAKVLYSAVKGCGAFKNDEEFQVIHNNECFTFVSDRSFMKHPRIEEVKIKLVDWANQCSLKRLNIIEYGGAAMNAMWVLENAPSCYFKFPKKELGGGSLWDYAASACIIQEAGAIATDCFGNTLDLNRADSVFMNHKGISYSSDQQIDNFLKAYFKKELSN